MKAGQTIKKPNLCILLAVAGASMQHVCANLIVLLPMLSAVCHLCPLTEPLSATSTYDLSLTSAQACKSFDPHLTAVTT